jgi:hypothetical protein
MTGKECENGKQREKKGWERKGKRGKKTNHSGSAGKLEKVSAVPHRIQVLLVSLDRLREAIDGLVEKTDFAVRAEDQYSHKESNEESVPRCSSQLRPVPSRLLRPGQVRRYNLTLNRLLPVLQFFVDRRKGVPTRTDDWIDTNDLGELLDGFLESSLRVGVVGLAEETLDFGRGFNVGGSSTTGL